jgi:hypothetical protein
MRRRMLGVRMDDDKSECNGRGWVSVEESYLRIKCGRGVGGMMWKGLCGRCCVVMGTGAVGRGVVEEKHENLPLKGLSGEI